MKNTNINDQTMVMYVDSSGRQLFATNGEPPEGGIPVDSTPEYFDQIWNFPGWSSSAVKSASKENSWREEQMPIAQQNVTAFQFGEADISGTEQQWKEYWLALRKWNGANPDFPDSTKRPVAPA